MKHWKSALAWIIPFVATLVGLFLAFMPLKDAEIRIVAERPILLFSKDNTNERVAAYNKEKKAVVNDDVSIMFIKYWATKKSITSDEVLAPLKICFSEDTELHSVELVDQNEDHKAVNNISVRKYGNCFTNKWDVIQKGGDGATIKVIYSGNLNPELSRNGGFLDREIVYTPYKKQELTKVDFLFSPYIKEKEILSVIFLWAILLSLVSSAVVHPLLEHNERWKKFSERLMVSSIVATILITVILVFSDAVFGFFDIGGTPNF